MSKFGPNGTANVIREPGKFYTKISVDTHKSLHVCNSGDVIKWH